jgi:hypothetical protein
MCYEQAIIPAVPAASAMQTSSATWFWAQITYSYLQGSLGLLLQLCVPPPLASFVSNDEPGDQRVLHPQQKHLEMATTQPAAAAAGPRAAKGPSTPKTAMGVFVIEFMTSTFVGCHHMQLCCAKHAGSRGAARNTEA